MYAQASMATPTYYDCIIDCKYCIVIIGTHKNTNVTPTEKYNCCGGSFQSIWQSVIMV